VSSTYAVDGASVWSDATATNGALMVNVEVIGDGVHTLLLKGRDAAGNESPSPCRMFSWVVDTTTPTVDVISPAPGIRTRNDWIAVSVKGDEALSGILFWLPGAVTWSRSTAETVVLSTAGVGSKYVFFKGGMLAGVLCLHLHLASCCFPLN
jgi:hypothetical protein